MSKQPLRVGVSESMFVREVKEKSFRGFRLPSLSIIINRKVELTVAKNWSWSAKKEKSLKFLTFLRALELFGMEIFQTGKRWLTISMLYDENSNVPIEYE